MRWCTLRAGPMGQPLSRPTDAGGGQPASSPTQQAAGRPEQQAAGRIRRAQAQQRAWAKKPRLMGGGTAPDGGTGHPDGSGDAPFSPLAELLPQGWAAEPDWLPTAWETLSGT